MPNNDFKLTVDTSQAISEIDKVKRKFGQYSDEAGRFSKAMTGATNFRLDPMTKYLEGMRVQLKATTQASLDFAKSAGGSMTASMRNLETKAYSATKAITQLASGWRSMDTSKQAAGISSLVKKIHEYESAVMSAQAGKNLNFRVLGNASAVNGFSAQITDMIRQLNNLGSSANEAAAKVTRVASSKAAASNKWFQDDTLNKFPPLNIPTTMTGGGAAYSDTKIREMQQGAEKAGRATEDMGNKSRKAASDVDKLGNSTHKTRTIFDTFFTVFKYTGFYKFTDALMNLPGQVIRTAATMEQLKAGFEGVFGKRSTEEFQYVVDMANKYGKALDQVAPSYQKFAASTDYLGISASDSKRIFETVTQTITKVGGSSDDVRGTLTAMQQMLSKGTVMSEEFRLQFAERIPGAMKMGANAMGTTVEGFKKLMEQGGVLSSEFLPRLVTEMEKFSSGWEKSADTLNANWERATSSWQVFISEIVGGADALKALLKLIDLSDKNKAVAQANADQKIAQRYKEFADMGLSSTKTLDGSRGLMNDIAWKKSVVEDIDNRPLEQRIKLLRDELEFREQNGWGEDGGLGAAAKNLRKELKPLEDLQWIEDAKKQATALSWELYYGDMADPSRSGKIEYVQSLTQNISDLTKQTWTVTLDIPLAPITAALNALGKLFEKTDEYKLQQSHIAQQQAKSAIDLAEPRLKEVDSELEKASGVQNIRKLKEERASLVEGIGKAKAVLNMETEAVRKNIKAVVENGDAQKAFSEKWDHRKHLSNVEKTEKAYDTYRLTLEKNRKEFELGGVSKEQYDRKNADGFKDLGNGLAEISKKGQGAANTLASMETKVESLAWKMQKFNAEARGDSMTAGLMGIEEEYNRKEAELARLGKKSGKGADEALLEAQATKLAQQNKLTTQEYEKQQTALSGMLSTYAQLTDNPALKKQAEYMKADLEYGAKAQQNIAASIQATKDQLAITEGKTALEGESRVNMEKYLAALVEAGKILPELKQETLARVDAESRIAELNSRSKYAELLGDAKASLGVQIQIKQEEYARTQDATKRLVIEREIKNLQSRKDMNVSGLIDSGMAEYANKTYADLENKISTAIPNALDSLGEAISSNFTDLVTGAQNADEAFANMGKQLQQAIVGIIADIGILIVKMQLLEAMGFNTGRSLNGIDAGGASSGAMGTAKSSQTELNKLTSGIGDSVVKGLDKWGMEKLGIGSSNSAVSANPNAAYNSGMDYREIANAKAAGNTSLTGGKWGTSSGALGGAGLGSSLASGMVGGAAGATVGSMVRPDTQMPAMLGLGSGILAGSMLGGPWGMAIGAAVSLIAGVLTPATKKTEKIGEGMTLKISGGNFTYGGYDAYKTTTSGMFGSTSTSHSTVAKPADPDLVRKFSQTMEDYEKKLKAASRSFGLSTGSYKNFSFPVEMQFPPELAERVARNLSNLKAEEQLDLEGRKSEFEQYLKPGEVYVDELERLGNAMREGRDSIEQYGFSIEQLSGRFTEVGQADYVSRLSDAVGSYSEVADVLQMVAEHTKDNSDTIDRQLTQMDTRFQRTVGLVGDAGLTQDNFWGEFDKALQSTMDPDKFADWTDAAKALDTLEQAKEALKELGESRKFAFGDLEVRALVATGRDEEAAAMQRQIGFERELLEARKLSYGDDYIARLREVQILEEARVAVLKEQERINLNADLKSQILEKVGTFEEKYAAQIQKNKEDEFATVWKYGYETVDLQKRLHDLELQEMVTAYQEERAQRQKEITDDMAYQRLVLDGRANEAEALTLLNTLAEQMKEAIGSGLDQSKLDALQQIQQDRVAAFWKAIQDDLRDVADTLAEKLDEIKTKFTDFTNGQLKAAESAYSLAQASADAYHDAGEVLRDTLKDITTGNLSALSLPDRFNEAMSYFQDAYTKGRGGDAEAMSDASGYAQRLLEVGKEYFTTTSDYNSLFAQVRGQLGDLTVAADVAGGAADYQAELLRVNVDMYNLLNQQMINGSSVEKMQETVNALIEVQNLLKGTMTMYVSGDATAGYTQQLINSQTGQIVHYGGLDVTKTEDLLSKTEAGNLELKDQTGAVKSGNVITDVLADFTEKHVVVSNEIRDAILGQQGLGNTYLKNISEVQPQLLSLFSQFLELTAEQKAEQALALKKAEVAALESKYMQSKNTAVATFQGTTAGRLYQGVATSGAGWQGAGLYNSGYAWTKGQTVLNYLTAHPEEQSAFLAWYQQNYGAGSGYVDWNAAMSEASAYGGLGGAAGAYTQAQTDYAAYMALKAQYGFATGGIMTSSGPAALRQYEAGGIANSPQVALFGEGDTPEAYVPLEDGRTIPVTVRGGGGASGEMAALRAEIRSLKATLHNDNVAVAKHIMDGNKYIRKFDAEGLPKERDY